MIASYAVLDMVLHNLLSSQNHLRLVVCLCFVMLFPSRTIAVFQQVPIPLV